MQLRAFFLCPSDSHQLSVLIRGGTPTPTAGRTALHLRSDRSCSKTYKPLNHSLLLKKKKQSGVFCPQKLNKNQKWYQGLHTSTLPDSCRGEALRGASGGAVTALVCSLYISWPSRKLTHFPACEQQLKTFTPLLGGLVRFGLGWVGLVRFGLVRFGFLSQVPYRGSIFVQLLERL